MASDKWAGFTDEDIERIKTNPTNSDDIREKLKNTRPLSSTEISKAADPEDYFTKAIQVKKSNINSNTRDGPQRCTSSWETKKADKNSSASVESLDNCTCEPINCENYSTDLSDESCDCNLSHCEEKDFGSKSHDSNSDLHELEVFEVRQKRIEAENARRRALITKAILDKKKKTQAEASKLTQITEELNRLDSMLSTDVSILRNYIEKASLEFSEAEKRYLRAEKELIEAKFLLFDKMQRKEQLTEHLCAIIEQNENRKANKLVELMKQLEMETIIEDFETHNMQPILSKYCVMNEEAYHCCQTLKPSPQTTCPTQTQQTESDEERNVSPTTDSTAVDGKTKENNST